MEDAIAVFPQHLELGERRHRQRPETKAQFLAVLPSRERGDNRWLSRVTERATWTAIMTPRSLKA